MPPIGGHIATQKNAKSHRFGRGPVAREPVQAQVYRTLKQAILCAQVKPGEILSVRVIAEDFNTSTMPVREAAARLISERALESLPNRGLRVPTLTQARAKEIFDVRVILESHACEIAAKHITDSELANLEYIEHKMERALGVNDVQKALQLNTEFHFLIYKAARCETLIPLIESLWLQYAPTLYILLDAVGNTSEKRSFVHNYHSAIFEALKLHSPDKAREALLEDLHSTANVANFWSQLSQDTT